MSAATTTDPAEIQEASQAVARAIWGLVEAARGEWSRDRMFAEEEAAEEIRDALCDFASAVAAHDRKAGA